MPEHQPVAAKNLHSLATTARWLQGGKTGDGSLRFANKNGLPVAKEFRPQKIWADPSEPPIKTLPTIFNTDYAILVSDDVISVFDGFDMGEGGLLPMDEGVFQADEATRFPVDYCSWIIGNQKSAVLLDETEGKMKLNPVSKVWHLSSPPQLVDNSVAVSRAAIEGPDQWVDPTLQGSLFLSRKLGDRIVSEGLKEAFFLYRCPVIRSGNGNRMTEVPASSDMFGQFETEHVLFRNLFVNEIGIALNEAGIV